MVDGGPRVEPGVAVADGPVVLDVQGVVVRLSHPCHLIPALHGLWGALMQSWKMCQCVGAEIIQLNIIN